MAARFSGTRKIKMTHARNTVLNLNLLLLASSVIFKPFLFYI